MLLVAVRADIFRTTCSEANAACGEGGCAVSFAMERTELADVELGGVLKPRWYLGDPGYSYGNFQCGSRGGAADPPRTPVGGRWLAWVDALGGLTLLGFAALTLGRPIWALLFPPG